MATPVYRSGAESGEGIDCVACRGTGWAYYQVETLDGEWEDAMEICGACAPKVSTKHVTVDERVAEILARDFSRAFDVIDIRETLEFEPIKKARGILAWATEHEEPYQTLRNYAQKLRTGHYRPSNRKPEPEEEYARYLRYRARKEAEKDYLTQGEEERIARDFFAPSARARTATLHRLGVAG